MNVYRVLGIIACPKTYDAPCRLKNHLRYFLMKLGILAYTACPPPTVSPYFGEMRHCVHIKAVATGLGSLDSKGCTSFIWWLAQLFPRDCVKTRQEKCKKKMTYWISKQVRSLFKHPKRNYLECLYFLLHTWCIKRFLSCEKFSLSHHW